MKIHLKCVCCKKPIFYDENCAAECSNCFIFYVYSKDTTGIWFYNLVTKLIELDNKEYYVTWDLKEDLKVHFCELVDAKTNNILMKLPDNTPYNITSNKLKTLITFS